MKIQIDVTCVCMCIYNYIYILDIHIYIYIYIQNIDTKKRRLHTYMSKHRYIYNLCEYTYMPSAPVPRPSAPWAGA